MAHWKQRETAFSEYELALTLPGRWQLRPSDSPTQWLYRSAEKHKEHVTVIREEPDSLKGQEEETYRRLVARRRRALELAFGRANGLSMTEPELGERFGHRVIAFRGEAPAAEHRFEVLFLCLPRTVWTIVYDAFRLTPEQAEDRARTIFDSAVMHGLAV